MTDKSAADKMASPVLGRPNAKPGYDRFDSLRMARSKPKQPRQERQPQSDDQQHGDILRKEE